MKISSKRRLLANLTLALVFILQRGHRSRKEKDIQSEMTKILMFHSYVFIRLKTLSGIGPDLTKSLQKAKEFFKHEK